MTQRNKLLLQIVSFEDQETVSVILVYPTAFVPLATGASPAAPVQRCEGRLFRHLLLLDSGYVF